MVQKRAKLARCEETALLTQEEAMKELDRLRVFDWEGQNEQAWLKEK